MKKKLYGTKWNAHSYTYDDANRLSGISIPGVGYVSYGNYRWNQATDGYCCREDIREIIPYDALMRVRRIERWM